MLQQQGSESSVTISHCHNQRCSLELILAQNACLFLQQKLGQLVVACASGEHQRCHSVNTLSSVNLDFSLTALKEGLNRLNVTDFTSVGECCLVLSVSVLPGKNIRC